MLVNKKKIAELTDLSVSMIDKLIAQGLPHIKIGKSIRFEPDVVIQWLKERSK